MSGESERGRQRNSHFSMDTAEDMPADVPPVSHSAPEELNRLAGGLADRDTLLTAALLLLLIREGGDNKLLLALAYILL